MKTLCKGLVISLLIFNFLKCTSSEPSCKLGEPVALLNENISGVTNHHFEVEGLNSMETATIEDTLEYTFLQSGCEVFTKEFQFEFPAQNYENLPDSVWAKYAAIGLSLVSTHTLDPSREFLLNFATDLSVNAAYVSLNKKLTLEEYIPNGYFIMRKVASQNSGRVIIEIKNDTEQ